MQAKIDNFEISFIEYSQKYQKNGDKMAENPRNISKEKDFPENSQISDQIEFTQSNNSLPTERKSSHDSISICASQAETLSQTSESSFFLSYANQNSQPTSSSNELIQVEKHLDENIPFYHGIKEYFQNLMPDKFIDYTKTKNYIHKNICLKNYAKTFIGTKNKKANISHEDFPMKNCFYFPVYYYPMNSFYFNNFSKAVINNYNNKIKKENDKVTQDDKNKEDVIKTDEKNEEEKEDKIEILSPKNNIEQFSNNSYYNSRRYQGYKKKAYYNNNQRYNRHYNKYSNFYYDNENYQEGRPSYYYNNNFYKRRYQKPFENKFYSYK